MDNKEVAKELLKIAKVLSSGRKIAGVEGDLKKIREMLYDALAFARKVRVALNRGDTDNARRRLDDLEESIIKANTII